MLLLLWDLQQQQHLDGRLTMVAAQVDKFVIQLRLSENLQQQQQRQRRRQKQQQQQGQLVHCPACSLDMAQVAGTAGRRRGEAAATTAAFWFFLLPLFAAAAAPTVAAATTTASVVVVLAPLVVVAAFFCSILYCFVFCGLSSAFNASRSTVTRLAPKPPPTPPSRQRQHNSCFTPQPRRLLQVRGKFKMAAGAAVAQLLRHKF